jgi:hypothetical protein
VLSIQLVYQLVYCSIDQFAFQLTIQLTNLLLQLTIAWAERYINKHSFCEHKLIVVLSDGYPSHAYDNYHPPASSKDAANIVRKIINRGTSVIAVSLDEEESYSTYEELKEIYPDLVACNDLNRLTGQLLAVISRQLKGA